MPGMAGSTRGWGWQHPRSLLGVSVLCCRSLPIHPALPSPGCSWQELDEQPGGEEETGRDRHSLPSPSCLNSLHPLCCSIHMPRGWEGLWHQRDLGTAGQAAEGKGRGWEVVKAGRKKQHSIKFFCFVLVFFGTHQQEDVELLDRVQRRSWR